MSNSGRGIVAYINNGTTGESKFKELCILVSERSSKVISDPPRLLQALNGRCVLSVCLLAWHLLAGLVVKASAPRAKGPEFESRLRRDFSGLSHTLDLKFGTPVATLPGVWRYRVSAGTGCPLSVYCDWVR